MDPLSLYLHIPFCRHRCAYCDFNTYTTVNELQAAYVDALAQEIRQVGRLADEAGQVRPLRTVFFGGGTPSLLDTQEVAGLINSAREMFGLLEGAEVTLEANPETVDLAYLEGLRRAGVNRLSFGVQSADQTELALLERIHDFATVERVIAQSRQAGFTNLSVDLIYGLPDQGLDTWERSLRAVLALDTPHISLYCLTIEAGTPMERWLHNGRISTPDPDRAAEQYELACELLAAAGYEQYEISNWARPGYECRHNLAYWRDDEYLGLGAGAHGKAAGYRYALVRQPRVYIRRMSEEVSGPYPLSTAVAEAHRVEREEAISDRVITQLRLLKEGLDLSAFHRQFGETLDETSGGSVAQLEAWGLLRQENARLYLTDRARFISNQVFYRLM
jgi:oxygen-independent coproporphyrinogen-3 oxidase